MDYFSPVHTFPLRGQENSLCIFGLNISLGIFLIKSSIDDTFKHSFLAAVKNNFSDGLNL